MRILSRCAESERYFKYEEITLMTDPHHDKIKFWKACHRHSLKFLFLNLNPNIKHYPKPLTTAVKTSCCSTEMCTSCLHPYMYKGSADDLRKNILLLVCTACCNQKTQNNKSHFILSPSFDVRIWILPSTVSLKLLINYEWPLNTVGKSLLFLTLRRYWVYSYLWE